MTYLGHVSSPFEPRREVLVFPNVLLEVKVTLLTDGRDLLFSSLPCLIRTFLANMSGLHRRGKSLLEPCFGQGPRGSQSPKTSTVTEWYTLKQLRLVFVTSWASSGKRLSKLYRPDSRGISLCFHHLSKFLLPRHLDLLMVLSLLVDPRKFLTGSKLNSFENFGMSLLRCSLLLVHDLEPFINPRFIDLALGASR
jgi:hypothetical protein